MLTELNGNGTHFLYLANLAEFFVLCINKTKKCTCILVFLNELWGQATRLSLKIYSIFKISKLFSKILAKMFSHILYEFCNVTLTLNLC